jgi:hypothetical protein
MLLSLVLAGISFDQTVNIRACNLSETECVDLTPQEQRGVQVAMTPVLEVDPIHAVYQGTWSWSGQVGSAYVYSSLTVTRTLWGSATPDYQTRYYYEAGGQNLVDARGTEWHPGLVVPFQGQFESNGLRFIVKGSLQALQ